MVEAARDAKDNGGRDASLGSLPFAGKYTVERVLGQGGMGTVFEARHARLGQRVAIKVLGSELRDYPELVLRFEREARAAGSLTSPHAVRVFDIDLTHDGTPFIVMELLHGEDLAQKLERDGAQPVGRAVRWIAQACDAIAEAHAHGIIHRDIKPSNLFLSDEGGIKVLDFGIAKRLAAKEAAITNAIAPLGTPQYMSPEQVRCAKDVDVRTDVWSLGVTLYELVTGRPPFNHEIPQACIAAIAADPVPDPRTFRADLPEDLAKVILRALAKDPTERYESVPAFVAALAPFEEKNADGQPSSAVQRVLSGRRSSASFDISTLDGEPLPLVARAGRSSIPPAISRAREHTRPRWGSRIAAGAAAVLGLAALVLTPRCVAPSSAGSDARVAPVATAAATSLAADIVVAPPPPPAKVDVPAPAPIETAEAAPAPVPVKVAVRQPAFKAPPPPPPPPPAKRALPKPSKNEPAPRTASISSPVHGGLSHPGF